MMRGQSKGGAGAGVLEGVTILLALLLACLTLPAAGKPNRICAGPAIAIARHTRPERPAHLATTGAALEDLLAHD